MEKNKSESKKIFGKHSDSSEKKKKKHDKHTKKEVNPKIEPIKVEESSKPEVKKDDSIMDICISSSFTYHC